MKRILISLLTIGVAGAAAFGASQAFFSDTETSTGNTFTAGAIDLTIDSQCSYNGGSSNQCGSWGLKDLNPTADKFFSFTDIKPGDRGENTISLHVIDNDAYACLTISNMQNNDNGLTEPEQADGDNTSGPGEGELANSLEFFAWGDIDGDNAWDLGEPPLFTNIKGPASDVLNGVTYTLADPSLGAILKGTTRNIGIEWCFGSMTVNQVSNLITCNGQGVDNKTQSDSLSADVSFYVEQARNNPNFVCSSITHGGQVLDYVDIGESGSMTAHSAAAWLPDPLVGDYGGRDGGGTIAMVMGEGGICDASTKDATVILNAGVGTAHQLIIRHYDGQSNDSFDVFVGAIPVGNYTDIFGGEDPTHWLTDTYPVNFTGSQTIKIVATGPVGALCAAGTAPYRYGQVAVNWIEIKN